MAGSGTPNIYLKAGEFIMLSGPACVLTVLGSCVSVTMFNKRMGMGAICHALLPRKTGDENDFKFVDSSIVQMIKAFEKLKIGRHEIEVKLFGGADMFRARTGNLWLTSIGDQNVKTALSTIERENLRLRASDIGGRSGRKIYYYIHENRVLVKRLKQ